METVLQPSLHRIEEFVSLVLDEAEAWGVDVDDIRAAFEKDGLSDDYWEVYEAIERLETAGHVVHDEEDTFIIHSVADEADCGWCQEERE